MSAPSLSTQMGYVTRMSNIRSRCRDTIKRLNVQKNHTLSQPVPGHTDHGVKSGAIIFGGLGISIGFSQVFSYCKDGRFSPMMIGFSLISLGTSYLMNRFITDDYLDYHSEKYDRKIRDYKFVLTEVDKLDDTNYEDGVVELEKILDETDTNKY